MTTDDPPPSSPLTIFRGAPTTPNYSWSSFVNKLEALLRFHNIPHKLGEGFPFEAPKGKIPYVKLPDSSLKGDSHFILRHLVRTNQIPDPNASLTSTQKALEVSTRAMIEDRLYFFCLQECWITPSHFYLMRDIGPLSSFSYPLRLIIGEVLFIRLRLLLHGQGTSRYTGAECADLVTECLDAIDDLLASRPSEKCSLWALGTATPTELDGTLFGLLTAVLVSPATGEVKKAVRAYPRLMDYVSRIHGEYFPEYEKWEAE